MSREYMVLFVDPDEETGGVDDAPAQVFMRFTEAPDDDFLQQLAHANPGRRVFCLMGASTWFEEDKA